ncbi:EamA family transporter [Xanthomonas campestris]|uniref:EamA family transporter n=1 Tax=Xanthomonas campestris TaxID=339 RepID=UPI002366CDA9|nr:EamA family transporter [Xanthomonas campestris]WDJ07100.1 EamA family transporter [Xanthomonas campestris pv. incanae]
MSLFLANLRKWCGWFTALMLFTTTRRHSMRGQAHPERGNVMIREIPLIFFVTCSTIGSQLLVKHGLTLIAARTPAPTGRAWLLAAVLSPSVITAVAVQGIGFLVWMLVVRYVKLGVAFAISGAFFYLLLALLSWLLYGERLTPWQWVGLVLISTGVALVSLTAQAG